MPAPEIQRAADFLAAHALLLLGLGIAAVAASFVVVVVLARLLASGLARLLPIVQRRLGPVLNHGRLAGVRSALVRTRAIIPRGFAALHLLLGLTVTAAVMIFIVIAEEVMGNGTVAMFDVAFARSLHAATTPEWARLFSVVTLLGSRLVLGAATAIVALALWRRFGPPLAAAWIATQAGGTILNVVLKETFERVRPEFPDPAFAAVSWSFPSGHAMGTFVFCGVASYLALRGVTSRLVQGAVVTLALSWCLIISFSRLYLGVHYASDVVAGMIAGTAWVAVCLPALGLMLRTARRPALPAAYL